MHRIIARKDSFGQPVYRVQRRNIFGFWVLEDRIAYDERGRHYWGKSGFDTKDLAKEYIRYLQNMENPWIEIERIP